MAGSGSRAPPPNSASGVNCSPPVTSGRRPPDEAASGQARKSLTEGFNHHERSKDETSHMAQCASTRRNRAGRGGLQLEQLEQLGRFEHSRGQQHDAPASIPIYQHANLAYLGGIPFTPVPATAPNSIQFWSVSVGDNAASAVYAGQTLHVKSVAIVYFSNPQGESLLPQITPVFKAAGVTTIHDIPLSPTSPDPSPQAALVESSGAELAYIDVPNGCGNVLKALKTVGYSGKLMGIDPCGAPPVIAAAAGGANGMYIASPFLLQSGSSQQAQLFQAAMKKWAAPGTLIDSISTAGFATVINVQQAMSTISGTPTTQTILAAFKSGTHPNFLSHPYTCNGQAMKGAPAICNDYYLMNQIENGALTQPSSTEWVTSKGYFPGLTG